MVAPEDMILIAEEHLFIPLHLDQKIWVTDQFDCSRSTDLKIPQK